MQHNDAKRTPALIVAIASYGTKNTEYLYRLIDEYRSMRRYNVDIVVLSNIPRDLGPGVEVIVGLPTKDPWSLPFGHKEIFAQRLPLYDLFIYSEDDTLISERNIEAFLDVSKILPDQYIAGFLRYEVSPEGKKYYSTIHGHYHWDPHSVLRIADNVFAHYTNEHSASFILTQNQLKGAIESGGFLLPPRTGRYDMLVTAATDPYTQCGMKKVICVSRLEDFCLHHLPNVYCGKIGLDAQTAEREIDKLKTLCTTTEPRGPLFETTTLLEDARWDKLYYEPIRKDILSLIPQDVGRVLSVGCACGSTEAELIKRGIDVMGIPLDCVIQQTAVAKGIRTLPPHFDVAKEALRGESFDCILFPHVLQHLPDPVAVLNDFLEFLRMTGSILISIPNFNHVSRLRTKKFHMPQFSEAFNGRHFESHRLHFTNQRMLQHWLNECGLQVARSCTQLEAQYEWINRATHGMLSGLLSRNIVVLSRRAEGKSREEATD